MQGADSVRRKSSQRLGFGKGLIINAAFFVSGVIISGGAVLGNLSPFGASFAAAVPWERLLPSALGAALGYIMLDPSDGFRYLAVLAAISAARWLMNDIPKISRSRLFAPLVAFVPIFATGVALLFGSQSTLSSFADCAVEAVISGAAAYFISTAMRLVAQNKSLGSCTSTEAACLALTGCVMILALGPVAYEGISLGRIVAVAAVLVCAYCGSVSGGAVGGVATGAVFSLSNRANGFICGGYAFGGLTAGLFAPLGRLGCAASFVLADSVMSLAFGGEASFAATLIEGLIGAAVFMVLPQGIQNYLSSVLKKEAGGALGETVSRSVVMRLRHASRAIGNVKKDVEDVSKQMTELYSPGFETVCNSVAGEVCSKCGLRMYCYEREGGVTRDDFFRLEDILAENGRVSERDIENAFVKKCCKKGELAASVNHNYRELCSALEAQRRVAELRGVVAGQFAGVSELLSDLSDEFASAPGCDPEASERITAALGQLGLTVTECVCVISAEGRMTVELELSSSSEGKLSRGQLAREVSRCCGKRLELPELSEEGGRIRAVLCEVPAFDVEIGTDQHIANHGKLCGDCLDYFSDGAGRFYSLVCDGMGTGGRAAVDGNMAVSVMGRLLRSGLSPDSSLGIVNSALMIKSGDESLSTLDVAEIDLFSGALTLKKAGAPPTYIKKSGRVNSCELPSLPAGILNEVRFSSEQINLRVGDMVLMASDGVVTGDDRWLERLIKSWNEGSAQELAEAVVAEAMRRRENDRDDDITAVAIRLIENE